MKRFEKGNSYLFSEIENAVNENDFELTNYGTNLIGEGFLKVKEEKRGYVCSFVLDGSTSNGFTYECIYTDF